MEIVGAVTRDLRTEIQRVARQWTLLVRKHFNRPSCVPFPPPLYHSIFEETPDNLELLCHSFPVLYNG